MTTITAILNQEIRADIYCPIIGCFKVRIVHASICTYSDGVNRGEELDEIMSFNTWFNGETEAKDWMKKSKVFKAALKAAIKYTPSYSIK
jgi:hypothetical protein